MEDNITRKLGLAGYHQNLISNMNRFTLFDYKIVFKNLKIWNTASMEDYHNGDQQNGRQPQLKKSSIKDNLNERQPQYKMT